MENQLEFFELQSSLQDAIRAINRYIDNGNEEDLEEYNMLVDEVAQNAYNFVNKIA